MQKKTTSPSWQFNFAADFDAMAEFTLENLSTTGRSTPMEELQLLSRQKPGEVTIDNFQELREALSCVLNRYEHLV